MPGLFSGAFLALSLSELAYFTAGGALLGVTPFFVVGPLASSDASVGLAMGAFSVTTVVARPLAGRWADRHGRRPLLVGGASLFAVLVAAHLLVGSLAGLVLLRMVLGVAEALYFVAGFTALADLAPPGRAGEALSYNSLSLYAGIAGGPVVGQALLAWGGFRLVWVGVTLLVVVAAVLALRVPETRRAGDTPAPPPLIHRAALVPGVALMAGLAAMSGFLAFGPLRAVDLGLAGWSTVLFVFGEVVITCRMVFATLPDRVRPLRLAAAALATSTVGLLLAATVANVAGLVLASAVLATGSAFLTPAVFAAIFARVPPAERGSAAGTASLFIDVGLGGGPLALGLAVSVGGIPAAFLLAASLALAGSVLLVTRPGLVSSSTRSA